MAATPSPGDCLTDHAHVEWSQQAVTAGGKEFHTNKFRCLVCGAEVRVNDTPTEISTRRRVIREAGRETDPGKDST